MKTPKALASDQFILPSQANIDAERRISWLSLWKAQMMSRYLSLARRFFCAVVPTPLGDCILDEVARRFRM